MSESPTPSPYLRCDVLLITVTQVETQAVFTVFEKATGQPATLHVLREKTYYDLHEIAHARIFLAQSNMGSRGPGGSAFTILAAIQMLAPPAVIMVGIAFGFKRPSYQVGDILVATHLRDYEIQRIGTASDGTAQVFARGERPHASSWLLDRCQTALYTWASAQVHFGLVLTGDKLVDQQAFLDQLHALEPETIGGEMEGAGLYAAATREQVDWLVIKASSDWGDGHKEEGREVRQQHAATNAAQFLFHVLQQGHLIKQYEARIHWPRFWSLPLQINPFFTGREALLRSLRDRMIARGAMALTQPQALSGLGGVGKTQIAVEYAYRYRQHYYGVFWINAASSETLLADYIRLATLFHLPEQDTQDPQIAVEAVKRWLDQHRDWLLLFDNADEPLLVEPYLPTNLSSMGHVLLTTRAQALGHLADPLEVREMESLESMVLLLSRARILARGETISQASSAEQKLAATLVEQLGMLSLALDQAGAYIEENGCSLEQYLERYQSKRSSLLALRGSLPMDHFSSVVTTFALSFQYIQQVNQLAAELLRLFAHMAPDAIPEEVIRRGRKHLGSVLASEAIDEVHLDQAIGILRQVSLIRKTPSKPVLWMHWLVQAVLRDSMTEEEHGRWANHAIEALDAIFPEITQESWGQCERLIPHVLRCVESATSQNHTLKLASVMQKTADYLRERAQYQQAEILYQHVIHIRGQQLGPDHPDLAYTLNNLAVLYKEQGKYGKAREQALGPEHPPVAAPLNNLAEIYREQGQYMEAEPLYQRAIFIRELAFGPEDRRIAYPLNNLAILYYQQGKYTAAEPLYQRALHLWEQALGPESNQVAISLNNLAELYREQGKYAEAEPLYQRAILIRKPLGLTILISLIHSTVWLNSRENRRSMQKPTCCISRHSTSGSKRWVLNILSLPIHSMAWLISLLNRGSTQKQNCSTSKRWASVNNN